MHLFVRALMWPIQAGTRLTLRALARTSFWFVVHLLRWMLQALVWCIVLGAVALTSLWVGPDTAARRIASMIARRWTVLEWLGYYDESREQLTYAIGWGIVVVSWITVLFIAGCVSLVTVIVLVS